jgi:hypothetical protein
MRMLGEVGDPHPCRFHKHLAVPWLVGDQTDMGELHQILRGSGWGGGIA